MTAYYNENDHKAAAWLRELIKQGHIAVGDVDERSIEDVAPNELAGYTQCHFFAGIGGWSYALRRAGWPDDRPVWTGSCPCQPFSAAGKGAGFTDERHLWPAWFHLISQRRPPVVFGEQVASKDGLSWIDLVQADLEGSGYAAGAFDLCAAGVGAPHIRQRLYFVADANCAQRPRARIASGIYTQHNPIGRDGSFRALADSGCELGQRGAEKSSTKNEAERIEGADDDKSCSSNGSRPSPTNGHWRDADWLYCTDGKWRAVEPSTFPLAHGSSARVGRLRGYGNAIVAPVAQAFIESYMEEKAA
jgi:DNA (cytosine-5)-methyltransferase 1